MNKKVERHRRAVPLGLAFLCLKGSIYNLDRHLRGRDLERLREERVTAGTRIDDYRESKLIAPRDSLVTRYYIRAGDVLVEELETLMEEAVSLLRSNLRGDV